MKKRILRLTVVITVFAAGLLAILIYTNNQQSREASMMECVYEDVRGGEMIKAEQDAIRLIHHVVTNESKAGDLSTEQINLIAKRLTDIAEEIRFHNTDPGYYEDSFCDVLTYMALLEVENALLMQKQGNDQDVKIALLQSRQKLNEAYQYMSPKARETTRKLMNELRKASKKGVDSQQLIDFRDQISQL